MLREVIRTWRSWRSAKARPTAGRPAPVARVRLEELEVRAAPSALQFRPRAFIVGTPKLDVGRVLQVRSYDLSRGSAGGTLAHREAPPGNLSPAHADASVSYSYSPHSLSIEEDTAVYSGAIYQSGKAQLNLNQGVENGGPGFVPVYIAPSYRGENHSVRVTLHIEYQSSTIVQSHGYNFVQFAVNRGGGVVNLLTGADYKHDGHTISGTWSFDTRVGSFFTVCLTLASFVGANDSLGGSLKLSITTQDR